MIAGLLLLGAAWLVAAPAPGAAAQVDAGGGDAARGDAIHIDVSFDPPEVTVGDRATAVLTVTVAAERLDGEPRFPTWAEHWGEAEIFAAPAPELIGGSDGRATFRQRLELAAFRPGRIALPPVTVTVPLKAAGDGDAGGELSGTASTPAELGFTILSMLPAPPDGEHPEAGEASPLPPRPEAPPRSLPLGSRFWWTTAAGTLACLLLGFLLLRRSPLGEAAAPAPALPPLAELEAALGRLGALDSALEGHILISLALRRYLGRELDFPAAESSTTEIRRTLSGRALPPRLRERTVTLLAACDLVKFARRPSEVAEAAERGETAREIARTLHLHLHPPQPEVSGGMEPTTGGRLR